MRDPLPTNQVRPRRYQKSVPDYMEFLDALGFKCIGLGSILTLSWAPLSFFRKRDFGTVMDINVLYMFVCVHVITRGFLSHLLYRGGKHIS